RSARRKETALRRLSACRAALSPQSERTVCATQRNRLAAAFRVSRRLIAAIGARGLRDAKKPPCGGFFAGKRVFI
ncbi:hypothetical protein, partial [Anaerotruncus massiliensis (ex Liu et al. 2021)]|uniref:hypothetical protein n=1 Tax=Anaerotruncus massiliensis (ex Liu et al. 2021) TaxID=2321404 RepID=UPI003AB67736